MTEYREARNAYNSVFVNENPAGRLDLVDKIRNSLYRCVEILIELHSEGKVETIKGLPKPEKISEYGLDELCELKNDLQWRYFPDIGDMEEITAIESF